jgi:hypothetical protein
MRRFALTAAALAAAFVAAPAPEARADMMSACAADIASLCSDVPNGRGRISACLMGYSDRLSPACGPEVAAVAASGSRNILVPSGVRKALRPGFQAPLPASCDADAANLCSGIPTTQGRIFACLYARDARVSATCSGDIDAALKAAN